MYKSAGGPSKDASVQEYQENMQVTLLDSEMKNDAEIGTTPYRQRNVSRKP
jgi:hypothetical protein